MRITISILDLVVVLAMGYLASHYWYLLGEETKNALSCASCTCAVVIYLSRFLSKLFKEEE